jgi:hypothetical protein
MSSSGLHHLCRVAVGEPRPSRSAIALVAAA